MLVRDMSGKSETINDRYPVVDGSGKVSAVLLAMQHNGSPKRLYKADKSPKGYAGLVSFRSSLSQNQHSCPNYVVVYKQSTLLPSPSTSRYLYVEVPIKNPYNKHNRNLYLSEKGRPWKF